MGDCDMGIYGILEYMNKVMDIGWKKMKIIWFWVNLKIKGIYERYFNKGVIRNSFVMYVIFIREERINGV